MSITTPSSNHHQCDAAAFVAGDAEEDPLGILRKVPSGLGHDRVDTTTTGSCRLLGPPEELLRVADCENGNPCEVIDAILRNSRAIRDRVSSRQALILDAYEAESQQLHKELSLLPPTYSQYRAVREKTNSRRRERTTAMASGRISSTAISHPLNFHLHGRCSQSTNDGVAAEADENERVFDDDGRASEESLQENSNRASLVCDGEGDARVERTPSLEGGGSGAVEKQAVEDQDTRRCSTLARVGSASENLLDRSLASRQPQVVKGSAGDVPALRRSKVRGRQMVFSLLEAARIEEEDMEDLFLACPVSANEEGGWKRRAAALQNLNEARRRHARELDALMAEYDPRPSRSRRENTLDKLRKALPWPEDVPTLGSGDGGRDGYDEDNVGGLRHEECFHGEAGLGNHADVAEDRRGEGARQNEDASDGGYYDEDFAGDDRPDSSPEARLGEGGEQASSHAGDQNESNGANAVTDRAGSGGGGGGGGGEIVESASSGEKRGNGDTSFALGKGDTREHSAGSRGVDSTGKSIDAADAGGGAEDVHPGSPPELRVPPVGGGNDEDITHAVTVVAAIENDEVIVRDDQGRVGVAAIEGQTKRPATGQRKKPTLPDPNEVNGSVMADPFNMDHIKDLPGLIGGDSSRGLSSLVRDTVSYIDPAFPNLEFHRRTAMDRAGYFMPGYKPQVNFPGPAAGAYWLERRHSYRVKMAAPPGPNGSNNDGGGRRQHLHHNQQQQRRPRRPPGNNATSSASTPVETDDRARRKNRAPVKGTTTSNNRVRPKTTTATSSTPASSEK